MTRAGGKTYSSVEMGDLLTALAQRLPKHHELKRPKVSWLGEPVGSGSDPITAAALYPRWEKFLRKNDILVAETGTASMGLGFARMPAGAFSIIKLYGDPLAGPRPTHSERPRRLPIIEWCSLPARARTSSCPRLEGLTT